MRAGVRVLTFVAGAIAAAWLGRRLGSGLRIRLGVGLGPLPFFTRTVVTDLAGAAVAVFDAFGLTDAPQADLVSAAVAIDDTLDVLCWDTAAAHAALLRKAVPVRATIIPSAVGVHASVGHSRAGLVLGAVSRRLAEVFDGDADPLLALLVEEAVIVGPTRGHDLDTQPLLTRLAVITVAVVDTLQPAQPVNARRQRVGTVAVPGAAFWARCLAVAAGRRGHRQHDSRKKKDR